MSITRAYKALQDGVPGANTARRALESAAIDAHDKMQAVFVSAPRARSYHLPPIL